MIHERQKIAKNSKMKWFVCFKSPIMLQFGESCWANFILLNPGSATPLDMTPQNGYLDS
jgi:hypothetical protein